MNRLARALLLWGLVLALPVQGWAATAMRFCGPGHEARMHGWAHDASHDAGSPARAAHPAEADAPHADSAHHDGAHGSPTASGASGLVDGADPHRDLAGPGHAADSSCSACAACCSVWALPVSFAAAEALRTLLPVGLRQAERVSSLPPDGLERPPRAVRA